MKNWNKALSLTIALIFIFSAVMPTVAATGRDEAGTLKDMGIIEGYENGDLKLEQTITRAEMCVVLSKLADMQDAAELLMDTPSKFSDVKVSAWYTGYINLASQQGWVSGYPDGNFRPNDNVTNAEALAMILNVLGYGDGELPGSWPMNYMVKAAQLDLLGDLKVLANDDALRGWVFIYAHEALNAELVTWSKDEADFVGQDKILIDALSNGSTGEITIGDAYLMVGSVLDDDDRTVEYMNFNVLEVASKEYAGRKIPYMTGSYDVADSFDIRPYVGVPTDFYLNSDDEIFAVKETTEVLTSPLKEVDSKGYFYLDNDDEDVYQGYYYGVGIINEQLTGLDMEEVTGGTLRYILNDDDYIIFGEVVDYDPADLIYVDGDGLVDEVEFDGDEVTIEFKNNQSDLNLDMEDDYILVMGDAESLKDIEEFDVLTWNREGKDTDYAIYVTRDSVEGEADRYTEDNLRVDGKTYDYAYEVSASYDKGDTFEDKDKIFDATDFSEVDVTLYLNGIGEIYAIMAATEASSDVAFVTDDVESDVDYGTTIYRVDLFLETDEHVTYTFDSDLSPSVGNNVYKGRFVEYTLNDDGEIEAFGYYESFDDDSVSYLNDSDTQDYDRVRGVSGNKFYATDDSVFVIADPDQDGDYDDAELISWTTIQSLGDVEQTNGIILVDEENDITYSVFYNPLAGDAGDYAVYFDRWSVGTDDYVSYINEAGIHEDEFSEDFLDEGPMDIVVEIVKSGSAVYFEEFPGDYAPGTIPEDAYNSDRNSLSVIIFDEEAMDLDVNGDTVVVDLTGDDPVLSSVEELEEDDLVMVYVDDEDLVLDFIVIHDEWPDYKGKK